MYTPYPDITRQLFQHMDRVTRIAFALTTRSTWATYLADYGRPPGPLVVQDLDDDLRLVSCRNRSCSSYSLRIYSPSGEVVASVDSLTLCDYLATSHGQDRAVDVVVYPSDSRFNIAVYVSMYPDAVVLDAPVGPDDTRAVVRHVCPLPKMIALDTLRPGDTLDAATYLYSTYAQGHIHPAVMEAIAEVTGAPFS